MIITSLRRPTKKDAIVIRALASEWGVRVRVRLLDKSIRVIGVKSDVRDILALLGYCTASGTPFTSSACLTAWNGPDEIFAYAPSDLD